MNMQSDSFKISFIIPVLNGEKYISRCLENIFSEMNDHDEIIVVDNGSTDATLNIVNKLESVKLVKQSNVSISTSRNSGAKIAEGDFFAFIDSDCLVCDGWREAAIEILSSNPIIAGTGSHYDLPENPTWVERAWLSSRKLSPSENTSVVGGNFIIKKSAFEAVNGFDEKLITDEDTDIGIRLRKAGFKVIYAPQVRVIHLGNAKTMRQFVKKEYWHATSIVQKMKWKDIDKPMFMTYAFLALFVLSVSLMPFAFAGAVSPLPIAGMIISIPVITVIYRTYHFRQYRYIFSLILLYFLFYIVRSAKVLRFVILDRFRTN